MKEPTSAILGLLTFEVSNSDLERKSSPFEPVLGYLNFKSWLFCRRSIKYFYKPRMTEKAMLIEAKVLMHIPSSSENGNLKLGYIVKSDPRFAISFSFFVSI